MLNPDHTPWACTPPGIYSHRFIPHQLYIFFNKAPVIFMEFQPFGFLYNHHYMKLIMRILLSTILLAGTASAFGYFFWYKPKFRISHRPPVTNVPADKVENSIRVRLKNRAIQAREFIEKNKYNDRTCFMIDMSENSGNKRFFVYDLKEDKVQNAGLVTHGGGGGSTDDHITFSNVINSNCTSLGKYKIGHHYQGSFGLAYKLYGLESTNNNAFNRFVVLHAHACVPEEEVSPLGICTSFGCPTVSPGFLDQLKNILDASPKPVLLWIFQ
jgi:hypothetical protein